MRTIVQILGQTSDVPIPRSTDWVPTLLLTVLWIFVAAAVAGAIFRYFRPNAMRGKP
jgi:hypothetical protein